MNNNEYKNTFKYDANGNIENQLRNGSHSKLLLDNLKYNYTSAPNGGSSNRLTTIEEFHGNVNDGDYADDFNSGVTAGVDYDGTGNLIADPSHHITQIKWNVYGKVTEVIKDKSWKAEQLFDIEYKYNEAGQRIAKIIKPHHATASDLKDQDEWIYTYYSYDASGNVIAVYGRDFTAPRGTATQLYDEVMELKEHHIYASSRSGMAVYENKKIALVTREYTSTVNHILTGTNPASGASYYLNTTVESRVLGTRLYELSNHLGNVLVVVSDKKIPVFENFTTCTAVNNSNTFTHYTADVQSTTDYSPFGAPLEGRTFASPKYRYGMNGQEKENEIYGDGDAMSAEYWMYDARLGRRWNVDPITYPWQSPYACFNNNPIYFADPLGLEGTNPDEGKVQQCEDGTWETNINGIWEPTQKPIDIDEISVQAVRRGQTSERFQQWIKPFEENNGLVELTQQIFERKLAAYQDPRGLNAIYYPKGPDGKCIPPQSIIDKCRREAEAEVVPGLKVAFAMEMSGEDPNSFGFALNPLARASFSSTLAETAATKEEALAILGGVTLEVSLTWLGSRGFKTFKNGLSLTYKQAKNITKDLGRKVSDQLQKRHLLGTAKKGGGYLNSMTDAQAVLDAVHSGQATYLGTTKTGHLVYKYDQVTGFNVNLGVGIEMQPTNVFLIKGTTGGVSIVPTTPNWHP